MDTITSSSHVAAKFEEFKVKLEKTPSDKIFDLLRCIPENELKSWTKNQWDYIFSVIEARIKPETASLPHILKFMEWIEPIFLKTSFSVFCTALVYVLKSIDSLLLLRNPDQSAVQGQTKSLIVLALKMLADLKVLLVPTLNVGEYVLLEKVLEYLSKIGIRKPSFVDIKIILDIWKSFLFCFTIYLKKVSPQDGVIMQLLVNPVTYLFQEIGRNIDLIHKSQALQQPIEQVEKYLRVTNFYIKLLRQFVPKMKHKKLVAVEEFSKSYKKAKFLPNHLIGTEIAELLNKYVQKDFDTLLSYVYQHPDIYKSILAFVQERTDNPNYVLFEGYLSAIISNDDGSFILSNKEDFIEIFEMCFKDSKLRFDSQLYDTIIISFAALTMLDETPNLLKYFRENVFKDNFWIALASTDVLILLQRYQYKNLDQCSDALLKEFHFWRDCHSKFALFSSDIKQTHIIRLLKNCWKLNSTIPNTQPFKNKNSRDFSPEDYRFFLVTGLHKHFEMNDTNLNIELCQLLNQLVTGNGTIESYYETIVYIQLLETYHSEFNEQAKSILAEINEKILNSDASQSKAFSLFISASLKLMAKFVEINPSYSAEKFLSYLTTMGKAIMFPGSLKLLNFYIQSSSPYLRQRANIALQQSNIDISSCLNSELISDAVQQIEAVKLSHNCLENRSTGEPQSKRKCIGFKY